MIRVGSIFIRGERQGSVYEIVGDVAKTTMSDGGFYEFPVADLTERGFMGENTARWFVGLPPTK